MIMRSSAGSVTNHLDRLKEGEQAAVQLLWERYFERLIRLARGKLRKAPRLASQEEDVALSALASFFRAVENGRFPQLRNRNDLWQILVMLAHRKIHRLVRRKTPPTVAGLGMDELFLEVINHEPTPQEAVEVAEECERLLDQLKDSKLRALALWKLEGYTNEEIAEKLGCVPRTVERKLQAIRAIWEKENRT
jgi:RNA polymerase sigma factor (sigma-70 family)